MSNLFTDSYKIIFEKNPQYFIYFLIGGRGIGKTYPLLKGCYENNKKILYLRTKKDEMETIFSDELNPYKAINTDLKINIKAERIKGGGRIIETDNDGNFIQLIGYGGSVNSFGALRGADFSDVDLIFYDEFINTSPMVTVYDKNNAGLFFNVIETVNRNRELKGIDPVKVVCVSNANTLDNNILRTLKLTDIARQLQEEKNKTDKTQIYTDQERGIYLSLMINKQVRDLKQQTSLYKLTKGTTFAGMALSNDFTTDYFGDIGKVDFRELIPVVNYENMYFYKHKSKNIMFVTNRKAQCKSFNTNTKQAFLKQAGYMLSYYIETGTMFYKDYDIKLDVLNVFK